MSTTKHKMSRRTRLRLFFEQQKVELVTVVVVVVYMFIIIIDIVVPDIAFDECDYQLRDTWGQVFWAIDMGFLVVFLIELALRTYAGGLEYLKDLYNLIDAIIILAAFSISLAVFDQTYTNSCDPNDPSCADDDDNNTQSLARLVRVVRIFRLITAVSKFQKTRKNTEVTRKKAKYKKTGSPIERVLDILLKLRRTPPFVDIAVDRENINFIMDVIISDSLYAVNLQGGSLSKDMAGFLSNTGVVSSGNDDSSGGKRRKSLTRGEISMAREDSEGASPKGKKSGRKTATKDNEAAAAPPPPPINPAARAHRRKSQFVANPAGGGPSLVWVDRLIEGDPVAKLLENAQKWDFDMFEFNKVTQGHPIVCMVLHQVKVNNLDDYLPINFANLTRYLLSLEDGYKDVPFHNKLHGADAAHGMTFFMMQPKVTAHLSKVDLYACILAAAMHDFEHPGVNNAFLVNSRHETALLYNDQSVLESFHVSRAWKLLLSAPNLDVFEGFTQDQYRDARATMIHTILGTDMKFHFDHLTKFKTRANANAFDEPEKKDVWLLLAMCLHAADVSNPAKPWNLSMQWTARVMEEFFQQGEQETEEGLTVSAFMDRATTNIAKCQVGFINFLIKPFFEEWTNFLGDECVKTLFSNVESNVAVWEKEGEEALGDKLAALKTIPAPKSPTGAPGAAPGAALGASPAPTAPTSST